MYQNQANTQAPRKQTASTHKNLKWIITILYILAFFSIVPVSIFMLLGGYVFAFDSPVTSSLDALERWMMIGSVTIAPILLAVAIIILSWTKSLWWSLLGLPSFIFALYFVGVSLLGSIQTWQINNQFNRPHVFARYDCPNDHAIEVYDLGVHRTDGTISSWPIYELSDSTTTLGFIHGGSPTFTVQISNEIENELATCKSTVTGKTFLSTFKNSSST